MMKYVKSPLNYIGAKYNNLYQIIPKFPRKIRKFVDLFTGGANIAMNVQAEKILINDINYRVIEVYKYFKHTELKTLLKQVHSRIKENELSISNQESYYKFRELYNSNQNPLDFFILLCYSFNHQYKFNRKGEFNTAAGTNKSDYNSTTEQNLINFVIRLQRLNIKFKNSDFRNISFDNFDKRDFIFCDPPYIITDANYNKGYTEKHEKSLYKLLDSLNERKIKFAITNVTHHKGKINEYFLNFSKKYNSFELNSNFKNSCYNTAKKESKELMVFNY